jgi:hypothetical protein
MIEFLPQKLHIGCGQRWLLYVFARARSECHNVVAYFCQAHDRKQKAGALLLCVCVRAYLYYLGNEFVYNLFKTFTVRSVAHL